MKHKRIYDSLHGFIRFNEIESALIDTFLFQRLHYIHQLGVVYLVYPGATHSRFEHSLGTLHIATLIFEQIAESLDYSHIEREYVKTVIRLAALTHDLGHLPFSHVAEKALLGKQGHEEWTHKIIMSKELQPIWQQVERKFPDKNVSLDIAKMAIGEKKFQSKMTTMESMLSSVITGDFFGADRIDYLLRDAQATGIAYGLFDYQQLIEMLRVLPRKGRLEIGIEENGISSCEALLLARYFMHKRVYHHSTVKAYAFHMARLIEVVYNGAHLLENVEGYLSLREGDILKETEQAAKDSHHPAHLDAKALMSRSHRFKVFTINLNNVIQDLPRFISSLNIPGSHIGFEVYHRSNDSFFSFPVQKISGEIVAASDVAEITIPSGPVCWVYVHPDLEKIVWERLSKLI